MSAGRLGRDAAEAFQDHYALTVGIDEYDAPSLPTLSGARRDARAVGKALRDVGYPRDNVQILAKSRLPLTPLWNGIWGFLDRVRALAAPRNHEPNILVFWAGHGIVDLNGRSYLAASTTRARPDRPPAQDSIGIGALAGAIWRHQARPGSLTMVFDCCHSALDPMFSTSMWADPVEKILSPICNEIRDEMTPERRRWAFLGVASPVLEVDTPAGTAGILSAAFSRGVRGELDGRDASTPYLSLEDLVPQLQAEVCQNAGDLGYTEPVCFRRDGDVYPLRIGLRVRQYMRDKLKQAGLFPPADLLARMVVDRNRERELTPFGKDALKAVLRLIRNLERDAFLKRERELVTAAVHDWQGKGNSLAPYIHLVPYCRAHAEDSNSADLLRTVYDHLLFGVDQAEFAEHLRAAHRKLHSLQSLPLSCGIRVVDGDSEHHYAKILDEAASIGPEATEARVFVTTAKQQRDVFLDVYWGSGQATDVRQGLREGLLQHSHAEMGRLSTEQDQGSRVWVRMLLLEDTHVWPDCALCHDATGMSVTMQLEMGLEGQERDWTGRHWHLGLGWGKDWRHWSPESGSPPSGPLSDLTRQCFTLWVTWSDLTEAEERGLADWMFRSEHVARERDATVIAEELQPLIDGLAARRDHNVNRLARALRAVTGSGTEEYPGNPATETGVSPGLVAEVTAEYRQWRDQAGPSEASTREADILAALLATLATDSAAGSATVDLARVLASEGSEKSESVGELLDALDRTAPFSQRLAMLAAEVRRFVEMGSDGQRDPTV